MSVKSNITALSRGEDDPITGTPYFRGLAGNYVRASSQIDWQKRIIGPGGQVFTPFAYLRGDAFGLDPGSANASALISDDAATRLTPAVGLEWSWPVMASVPGSTHIFEPIAQIIARPSESLIGKVPNDDSLSLVFDDSTLFDRDKFSGFDRAEGGTRLNAGLRYIGSFDSGFTIDGLFGQSYQLAGTNSFAETDVANTGYVSGLESDVSDYVGRLSIDTGVGPRFTARGRFDEKDFSIQRGEIEATNALGPITASAAYLYLREFPNDTTVDSPTSVLRGAASVNFVENWRLYGAVAYDITNNALASNSVGLAYDNSCVTFALAYSETREDYSDIEPSRQISFLLSLRTLADAQFKTNISGLEN
jgi:LPS-assembly protein